jgi:hypothetical protein
MPTTLAPVATSAAAIARPKPRLAPVTTAVWKGSDIGHSGAVVGFGPHKDQPPAGNPSPQPKSGE